MAVTTTNRNNKFLYNKDFLDGLLVGVLTDQNFLLKAMDLDMTQHILSLSHLWYMEFIIEFYKSYKSIPSMLTLQIEIESIKEPLLKQSISSTYVSILNNFLNDNILYIKDKSINFCRFQLLKKAISKSIDLLKLLNMDLIYLTINATRYKGLLTNLGTLYVDGFLKRNTPLSYSWVLTPWLTLNTVLKGGLRLTKLGILVAPAGTGKSFFLCNLAAHAIKLGKKVIYITLLMTLDLIGQRIDSILLRKTTLELSISADFLKNKLKLKDYLKLLRIKLFLPKKTKFILILNYYNQLRLFDDFDAEVLIVDYGDILKSGSSKDDMYSSYGDNFVSMKTFAKEYKKIVWSASQGKRSSMEKLIILAEDTAHSILKIEIGDFIVSLSRTHDDKLSDTARFLVVKNRGGRDGMVYNAITNFDYGEFQIYDNFTKRSVEARLKMDNNDLLAKQRIRLRLQAIKNNKLNK